MKRNLSSLNRLVFTTLLFTVGVFAQSTAPATDLTAKFDEYMSARTEVKGSGGTVLVVKDGKAVIARGYGLAEVEAKTPNTFDTKFRIGSITKQFTAAAILQLVEKNKLSLTDGVCKFVTPCPEAWQPVTIHHLLAMSSGIPSFTSLPEFREIRVKDLKPEETVALVSGSPLKFAPGDQFEYSNTNYVLLGTIIEKLSGKSYEKFLADSIFKPLKLTNTGYDHGKERIAGSALGYSMKDNKVVPADKASMLIPYAAGGLYSTVSDLYKWQSALLNGRVFKKKETLDAMLKPNKGNYAYGVIVVTDAKGRKRVTHGGGIEGFVTDAAFYPNEKLFIAFFANNDQGAASAALRDLTAIYFNEPYSVPKKRTEVKVDTAILDTYVGEYKLGPNFSFKITREDDGLMIEPTGQRKTRIYAENETDFFLTIVDATVKFEKDATGKVTGFQFTQNGRTSKAERVN